MEKKTEQPHLVAKPVHSEIEEKVRVRDLLAQVCFYYPQYTLQEAAKLPARDIRLLLKTARKLEATKYFNLVQIVAAPHTKKGKGVKDLSDTFRKEMG